MMQLHLVGGRGGGGECVGESVGCSGHHIQGNKQSQCVHVCVCMCMCVCVHVCVCLNCMIPESTLPTATRTNKNTHFNQLRNGVLYHSSGPRIEQRLTIGRHCQHFQPQLGHAHRVTVLPQKRVRFSCSVVGSRELDRRELGHDGLEVRQGDLRALLKGEGEGVVSGQVGYDGQLQRGGRGEGEGRGAEDKERLQAKSLEIWCGMHVGHLGPCAVCRDAEGPVQCVGTPRAPCSV